MSQCQKNAFITLIEKKGKDRSLIENWKLEPSKVIASRIKNVVPHIIHHNQTGHIKDRFTGETIRPIYDIMDWTVNLMIFINFQ